MSANWLVGLIIILLGVCTVICSFQTQLVIRTTSGTDYVVNFLVFEKSKAGLAADAIVAMIGARMNDTNTRIHTEKQMELNAQMNEKLINAVNNLKE